MLRYIFITILLVGTNIHSFSQITISGKVVDSANYEPLIGAQIMMSFNKGTITDKSGNFVLEVPEDQKEIQVKYLGYEWKSIAINNNNPTLGIIALSLSNTTLNEIIISASPENYSSEFAGSNYRISPVTLKNQNPLNTEEILQTIPGVNIVGDMGLSNRPNISIRGSWGRRSKKVLLMEDGSPSAPAPYIAPGAYYNPVSDRIASIEVYKGADILKYGPNNMYGAVNYITAMPPQRPELRLKLIGGQRNYTTGLLSYGGTWNNLGALVEGVYKKFDGFTNNSSVEILNLNAKIFAKLSDNQSLYFKVSAQFEDNQASLSSQTPFTFNQDPKQNPLDADQFTMRRYGVDIIHKWLPKSNISLVSKLYASDFERDWWRQVTAKVKASDVHDYVGQSIFEDRYGYLMGLEFDEEDYLIVGRVANGRESTTDSRWAFTVSGLKETVNIDWNGWGKKHKLELGLKLHQETYKDRFLTADSSRWARHGNTITDLRYYLWSVSGYARNEFNLEKFSLIPIIRFEHVDMYRQDLLSASTNPNLNSKKEGREYNIYDVLLPGVTLQYTIAQGELFGSIYQGFIAPSKVFGFLVEQDGIVSNPFAGESINIKPELSLNTELGWRGVLFDQFISGQITYFNNTSRNFYAGGRNEVFQELGKINIQGIELGIALNLLETSAQKLQLLGNLTLLKSKVKEGKLLDRDLFSQVIHNQNTRSEFINKVNLNRSAYEIYTFDSNGNDVLYTNNTLTEDDFNLVSKSLVLFGPNYEDNAKAPYTPEVNLSAGVTYDRKNLSMGISGHYVADQYTEFNNFFNESADGAIGHLPSYFTVDAYVNYDFIVSQKIQLNAFVNGKNLANQVYKASRLNRATSGIFPGGYRQIILGINARI